MPASLTDSQASEGYEMRSSEMGYILLELADAVMPERSDGP